LDPVRPGEEASSVTIAVVAKKMASARARVAGIIGITEAHNYMIALEVWMGKRYFGCIGLGF
jgi:hypothetical protein